MKKVIIVGLGAVGSTLANLIINTNANIDTLAILEKDPNKIATTMLDLKTMLVVGTSKVKNIFSLKKENLASFDTAFYCFGVKDLSREQFILDSTKEAKQITDKLLSLNFHGNIIVVSNPIDVLTSFISLKYLKDFKNIVGTGTMIDFMRLSYQTNDYHTKYELFGLHGPNAILYNDVYVPTDILNKALNMGNIISSHNNHSCFAIALCSLNLFKILQQENKTFIACKLYPQLDLAFSHKLFIRQGKLYSMVLDEEDANYQKLLDSLEILKNELALIG